MKYYINIDKTKPTMTTLTKTTALKAWELANEFDWEEDERFEDIHEALCTYYLYHYDLAEDCPDLGEIFQMVVEDVLNLTFDIDDTAEVDIIDELDDLGRANYCGLPELDDEVYENF